MKKIALSGVMGAGKSSVIAVLKEAGIPVFDCDEINAQLLRPKEAGHAALLERYGSRFIGAKGEIDRQALSEGILTGMGDGSLAPQGTAAREEMAAMLTGCGLVIAIRILSAHFRWNLPHAHD